MDKYADGGVLTAVAKSKTIPTVLFQEGFHIRKNEYAFNLYELARWFRSKLLSPWFEGSDGMRADYVAVWSHRGMKEELLRRGRQPDTISVVGNPLVTAIQSHSTVPLHSPRVVMVVHQSLNPRHASKTWNDQFYIGVTNIACSLGCKVLFKPHPRHIDDGDLVELRKRVETAIANCHGKIEWVDRNISSEELLSQCDAVITANSVSAYAALRMGLPTVFIRTPRSANELLEKMGQSGEIIYCRDWHEVDYVLKKVISNEDFRKHWQCAGPVAANKLSGDPNVIDGGFLVSGNTLELIRRQFNCLLIHYTPDSLTAPGMSNRCMRNAVAAYDVVITTKKQDIPLYENLHAKRIIFSLQGFDPKIHRPVSLTANQKQRLGCDVIFVGQYMKDRGACLNALCSSQEMDMRIYGMGWNSRNVPSALRPLFYGPAIGDEYAKVISASKISLGFLNHLVSDTYTTRTFEIPACGGFLLAERTKMHQQLFVEDSEVVFFSSAGELIDKVRVYLNNEEERKKIANAGYMKVISAGYTWRHLMEKILSEI